MFYFVLLLKYTSEYLEKKKQYHFLILLFQYLPVTIIIYRYEIWKNTYLFWGKTCQDILYTYKTCAHPNTILRKLSFIPQIYLTSLAETPAIPLSKTISKSAEHVIFSVYKPARCNYKPKQHNTLIMVRWNNLFHGIIYNTTIYQKLITRDHSLMYYRVIPISNRYHCKWIVHLNRKRWLLISGELI